MDLENTTLFHCQNSKKDFDSNSKKISVIFCFLFNSQQHVIGFNFYTGIYNIILNLTYIQVNSNIDETMLHLENSNSLGNLKIEEKNAASPVVKTRSQRKNFSEFKKLNLSKLVLKKIKESICRFNLARRTKTNES